MTVYQLSSGEMVRAVQTALADAGFEARAIPPVRGAARLSDNSVLDVFHTDEEADDVLQIILDVDNQARRIWLDT